MCSPSWPSIPPPSPSHPSGSFQCNSPEDPVSCIEPGLVICFTYDNILFQFYSLKSSHPHLLPQSPTVCSLHLCLFCCLANRVIVGARIFKAYVRLSHVTTNSSGHHFHVLYMTGTPRAQYNTSGSPWSSAVDGSLPLYFLSFLKTQRWLI